MTYTLFKVIYHFLYMDTASTRQHVEDSHFQGACLVSFIDLIEWCCC